MPINALATADIFMRNLDKLAEREAVTGWMDRNAGQVIYNGGATVKIPKLTVQGLGEYDRDNGYAQGSVGLTYETLTLTQDRGRKFHLDAMDVDETNFVATAGNVMAEFQRTYVIPEIDAYRISKIADYAITGFPSTAKRGIVEYGYTPGAANTSALRKFKEGVRAIRENGYNGQLVCLANDAFIMELELELAGKLQSVSWAQGGINTHVPAVDLVPVIATPANRMYTKITLYDGKTAASDSNPDQTVGGYVKASDGKDVNFMIMPTTTPIAVQKQDKMRIFSPDINQTLNAWRVDYRRFHDLWVLENKVNSLFVSVKQSAS
jgi:hypothetical protein